MKRIIATFFFVASVTAMFAGDSGKSLGVLLGFPQSVTGSLGQLEAGAGYYNGLYITADYKLFGSDLSISDVDGFYWNVGPGAFTDITSSSFGLGVRVAAEFGWADVEIEDGTLDFYLEAAPSFKIITGGTSNRFQMAGGLGIRYNF